MKTIGIRSMKKMSGKISTGEAIGLLAILLAGILGYEYITTTKTAVTTIQCTPTLVQTYGLSGEQVVVPMKVENPSGQPIAGADLYTFSTEPYGFNNATLLYTELSALVQGQTPAAVTNAKGVSNLTVTIPSVSNTSVQPELEYGILLAPGYWSDAYKINVGLNPALIAQSPEQCLSLYPYNTVQQLLPELVQVQAQNVLTGQTSSLTQLTMEQIGQYTTVNNITLPITSNQIGANLQGLSAFYVTSGQLRIASIKVQSLADLSSLGVKQITLSININGQTVYDNMIYNSLSSSAPLGNGANGNSFTIQLPNIELVNAGQGVQVQVNVVANTNTNSTAGYLGPNQKLLAVDLELADPLENQPIPIYVETTQ